MEEENWSPESAFKKAFSFVTYASEQMSKSGDPLGSFIGVALVWVFYFPAAMIAFPLFSFLFFVLKKAFRQKN
ncbi:MAG: hypothetical protein HY867_01670 [Chloroflexi bacterium]|nr:hypothetical protein [Chloroflexota bacterium]